MLHAHQLKPSFRAIALVLFLCSESLISIAWGQEIFTPKRPIASLVKAHTIYLQTEVVKGGVQIDPQPVTDVITQRFQQMGYKIVTNFNAPHDVTVSFQCEEPIRIQPPTNSTDKYTIQISGPPCLFHYAVQEKPVDWQRIDIIIYNEGVQAAESLNRMTTGFPSMAHAAPIRPKLCAAAACIFSLGWV